MKLNPEIPEACRGESTIIVKSGPTGYSTMIVPTASLEEELAGIDRELPSTGQVEIRIDGVSEAAAIALGKQVGKVEFGKLTRGDLLRALGHQMH